MESGWSVRIGRFALSLLGLGIGLSLWWISIHEFGTESVMATRFTPEKTLEALRQLIGESEIWNHAGASLHRVGLGLSLALIAGIPIGLMVGSLQIFNHLTSVSFQFLRMISPLSWMPVAVMVLGVGEAPVVFLIAFAAVWPIILNVAAGVRAIDPMWHTLAKSMGANRRETLFHVTIPAIAPHLLTGIRLAIGLIWVVLVPAEMLGVNAGLGYFILDTRDRMAYAELMATIILIGFLGFLLDYVSRVVYDLWSGK